MKPSILALLLSTVAVAALAPLAATPARADDTTIKQSAQQFGHTVAQSAKHVGHSIADQSRKLGHAVAKQSRAAGHSIAHGAHQVGSKAHHDAHKVKTFITSPPARKTGSQ
jgi:hypothetical protein